MINSNHTETTRMCDQAPMCPCHCCKRVISYTGIICGALMALGLTFLFNLLNNGFNLSALVINQEEGLHIVMGVLVWLLVIYVIISFFSGFVSGKLSKNLPHRHCMGWAQGFLTWCLAIIISLLVSSQISVPSKQITSHFTPLLNVSARVVADEHTNKYVNTSNQEVDRKLTDVALATFIIFLLGAAASSAGGNFGAKCKSDHKLCCPKHDMPEQKI